MVLEYLLYKLYTIYDDYVKTNDHSHFVENLLSLLTVETQSEFGLITKRCFSNKDLLTKGRRINIDSLLFMGEHKENISLQITDKLYKKKDPHKTFSLSFTLLEGSAHKSYICTLKNAPSIKSIQVFPIYLNREKSSFYVCALGNRKGGYTVALKRQLPLVMRTLSLLLSKHIAMEELRCFITDLEESKVQIERFAYMCSHDLKEPLRTIYSFLQLIKKESENSLTPQISQYYDFIFNGIYQMRSLIENLLIHSELGPKDLQIESFKLSDILDTVIKNNAHYVLENKARIQVDKDCSIFADKFLITQLIHNLVSNAFKYCKDKIPCVHIGGSFEETGWKIYVKDNGVGIDKFYHKDVFDQFMKLDKHYEYTSNGLGLSICKIIIEKHQGKIWLTSEKGKGTTFFFTIPANLKEKATPLNYDQCNLIHQH